MKKEMLNQLLIKMVSEEYGIDRMFLDINENEEVVSNCKYVLEFVNSNSELVIISIFGNDEEHLFVVIEDDRILIGDINLESDEVCVKVKIEKGFIKKYS